METNQELLRLILERLDRLDERLDILMDAILDAAEDEELPEDALPQVLTLDGESFAIRSGLDPL